MLLRVPDGASVVSLPPDLHNVGTNVTLSNGKASNGSPHPSLRQHPITQRALALLSRVGLPLLDPKFGHLVPVQLTTPASGPTALLDCLCKCSQEPSFKLDWSCLQPRELDVVLTFLDSADLTGAESVVKTFPIFELQASWTIHTHTHIYIYTHIYINIYVCVYIHIQMHPYLGP
jgi:hypothetical protein